MSHLHKLRGDHGRSMLINEQLDAKLIILLLDVIWNTFLLVHWVYDQVWECGRYHILDFICLTVHLDKLQVSIVPVVRE